MVDTPRSRQPVKLWQPKPLDPEARTSDPCGFRRRGIWYEDGSLAEPSDSLDQNNSTKGEAGSWPEQLRSRLAIN
jgi:hypothetical protein